MGHHDTILVVDDEEGIREFCVGALQDAGYSVSEAASGEDALAVIERENIDIVLTDLKMPGMDGIELLRQIREHGLGVGGALDVVVMTGHATIATAIEATRLGAYDYITKPFALDDLTALLERLVEKRDLVTENRVLREQMSRQDGFGGMVGSSPAMQELYRLVLKIAPRKYPVLIVGESGTGKELVARALHQHGPWRERPFEPVDCGALSPTLIESELFGHVKGSFTGSTQNRPGLFRTAQDGTIFLDEIGELPLELQAKLLRALQESEFRPVGGDERIPLRARVVAATNRDLDAAIRDKVFRADLYYRLNVVSINLPPLRERKEDIQALANSFIVRHADNGARPLGIAPEALDRLTAHDWPGNVRELENCIRRALAVAAGPQIEIRDLPPELRRSDKPARDGLQLTVLQQMERKAILDALRTTGGHRLNAAKLLGIGKTTLYSKLKEYQIDECDRVDGVYV